MFDLGYCCAIFLLMFVKFVVYAAELAPVSFYDCVIGDFDMVLPRPLSRDVPAFFVVFFVYVCCGWWR